ncbi:helix-turn-helix domain-containing protein [Catenulispora pinisilvae]|uniref:helix-turn-helix domain-containing protein n=1 Tax=Catenulispora pinisilvae TaxID=2705253 RepID=UPI0018926466|nr:helix-turn-helix domain-containing protein [Catenulispora pinisilvae]
MGGQRAEDERDGVGVGLDEADALRGGRFVGDEVAGGGVAGGIGVGARTAARTDTDTVTEVAAEQATATEPGTDAAVAASVPAPPATSAAPASPVTPSVPAAASEPGSVPDPDKAPAAKPVDPLAVDPTDLTDSQIVGRRLALARQHAGLSIEEVVAATRIRPGMLREIESGEFVHCGGDVYARGHVRAIAKVVGIDPEPLLAEHPPFVPTDLPVRGRSRVVQRPEPGKASGAQVASADDKGARSDKRSASPASNAVPTSAARDNAARFAGRASSRVIRPAAEGAALGVAGAGVGAAGKGGGVGAGAGNAGKDAGVVTAGKGSGSIRPPHQHRKDDPGKIERHPKSANWTAAMLVALLGLVVFAGVQLIDGGGGSGKPAAAAAPAAPAPKPVAVKPAPPVAPPVPKGVAVRIAAVGSDSWLAVTGPDGRILFDNLLPAGSTQNFQDPKQLGVTLGNAAAVHMTLNGKDLGSAGGTGEVVHFTLNPTGAVNG